MAQPYGHRDNLHSLLEMDAGVLLITLGALRCCRADAGRQHSAVTYDILCAYSLYMRTARVMRIGYLVRWMGWDALALID